MEQHAIPQNISSYQFRLVGDMTLKQFFQLAGGIVVGLFFRSLPILGIIKWPFAILSVILGIALAFLPLEERPLERWIFAFFKAIYSPTTYNWKAGGVTTKFFQDEPSDTKLEVSNPQQLDKLDVAEKGFLANLTGMFTQVVQPTPIQIPETESVSFNPNPKPQMVTEEVVGPTVSTTQVAPIIAGDEIISTHQAQFSIDAAPPAPPTIPNVAVGQIVDQDRKIIDGAIIEIKDSGGRPVRALRSNKAGHFVIVTPLENGLYEINTDKDGFGFDPVTFEASGAIIPPILIKGKRLGVGMQNAVVGI